MTRSDVLQRLEAARRDKARPRCPSRVVVERQGSQWEAIVDGQACVRDCPLEAIADACNNAIWARRTEEMRAQGQRALVLAALNQRRKCVPRHKQVDRIDFDAFRRGYAR